MTHILRYVSIANTDTHSQPYSLYLSYLLSALHTHFVLTKTLNYMYIHPIHCTDKRTNGRTNERTNKRTNKRTNERTNKQTPHRFYLCITYLPHSILQIPNMSYDIFFHLFPPWQLPYTSPLSSVLLRWRHLTSLLS